MIKTEFGIIDNFNEKADYSSYEPQKYHCVVIDDDLYLNDWWPKLILLKTYFHTYQRPNFGLARHGVTLIPPESLPAFLDIVITDARIYKDDNLIVLANKIRDAIKEKRFMIHFGV